MSKPSVGLGAGYWSNPDFYNAAPGSPKYQMNEMQIAGMLAQGEKVPQGVLDLYPNAESIAFHPYIGTDTHDAKSASTALRD
jgi:hypothetical protein